MSRLIWIALAVIVIAVGLGARLRRGGEVAAPASEATPFPRFEAEAELTAEGMSPHRIQVPKNREVHLLVRGAPDAGEGLLRLLGYEDLVRPADIGPGVSREFVFDSVRPGDDFGFALGEEVVGRLEVVGSHLEEGHR